MLTPLLVAIPLSLALALIAGAANWGDSERQLAVAICAALLVLVGVPYALLRRPEPPIANDGDAVDEAELPWDFSDRDHHLHAIQGFGVPGPLAGERQYWATIWWARRPVRTDDEPRARRIKQTPLSVVRFDRDEGPGDAERRAEATYPHLMKFDFAPEESHDSERDPLQLESGATV